VFLRKEVKMATSNIEADQAWGMLADVEEKERRTKMVQRYTDIAALPEEDRMSQMLMMATAEYALPDDKLRTFTISRLHAWLMLNQEVARRIATSYDTTMRKMPGQEAWRRVSMVQTLAREFPEGVQVQLVALIPDVFGGLKDVLSGLRIEPTTPAEHPASAKKGWWPFRKR